jgi:zinc protease
MDGPKVDLQRDVVKNERRQRVENQPYGLAGETLLTMLYPAGHPYSWPVIGSMADLSAASLDDVKEFFRRWYAPNNTTLVVAGDVQPAEVRKLVRGYFAGVPKGPTIDRRADPAPFALAKDTVAVLDDQVQLPRLYYLWHTVKRGHADDAALQLLSYILTGAKNTRLVKPMVYEEQLATQVESYQDSKRVDGDFTIDATARPGHKLPELQAVIDREIARIAREGPTQRELEQAKNSTEASFLQGIEQVGSKAHQLNVYLYYFGEADYFQRDIDRYRAATAADVRRVAREYLQGHKAVLSIVPQGKRDLAATGGVTP